MDSTYSGQQTKQTSIELDAFVIEADLFAAGSPSVDFCQQVRVSIHS